MDSNWLLFATEAAGYVPDETNLTVHVEHLAAGTVETISGEVAIEYVPAPRVVSLSSGQDEFLRLRFDGNFHCATPDLISGDPYWARMTVETIPAPMRERYPLGPSLSWSWFSQLTSAARIVARIEMGSPVRELPSLPRPAIARPRTITVPLGPTARFIAAEDEHFLAAFIDEDEVRARDALYRMFVELPLARANPCSRARFDEMLSGRLHANIVDLANAYLRHLMHTGTPFKAPANAKLTPKIAATTNCVWRGVVLRAQTGGTREAAATDAGDFGQGTYFTSDPSIAAAYARGPIDQPDRGAPINEHYLVFERPLVFKTVKASRAFREGIVGPHLVDKPQSTLAAALIAAKLRDLTHDGVIVYDGDCERSSDPDRPVEVAALAHPPVTPPTFSPGDASQWEQDSNGYWSRCGKHTVATVRSIHPHGWLVEGYHRTPQGYRDSLFSSLVTDCSFTAAETARHIVDADADQLPEKGAVIYDLRRDTRSLEEIGVAPGWFSRSGACSIWREVQSVWGSAVSSSSRDPAQATTMDSQGLHFGGLDEVCSGRPNGRWIAGDGTHERPRLKNYIDKYWPEPHCVVADDHPLRPEHDQQRRERCR